MHIEHIPGFAIESTTPSLPRTKICMLMMFMVKSQFIIQSYSFDRLGFLRGVYLQPLPISPLLPFYLGDDSEGVMKVPELEATY